MGQFFSQLAAMWGQWPAQKKVGVAAGMLFGVGTFAFLVVWGAQPTMTTLMSGLAPEDAQEVVSQLQADRIPYRIGASGTAVLVPQDKVHETRLRLAGAGIPKGGGVGFEIFDEAAFGLSQFAEQLNFKRGLEGELRRTITSLQAVRDARVHIVVPKRRLFAEQQESPKASVTLTLHRGRRLGGEQIQSVVHLVASSVEGLAPDQVTLVDSTGEVLSRGGGALGGLPRALEHQRSLENDLEERVTEMLGKVVGRENVSVRVTAEMDFSRSERTVENYDPDAIAVRSEQVANEQRSAAGQEAGIPGARSNIAGGGAGRVQLNRGAINKNNSTKNYEVSKEVTHKVDVGGGLTRLSIAVLVNGILEENAEGESAMVPRSEAELALLTELTQKAVGFNEVRGDQVVVQSMAFQNSAAEAPVPPMTWLEIVEVVWRPVVAMFMLLIALLFIRSARKAAKNTRLLGAPATVRELEEALDRGEFGDQDNPVPAELPAAQTAALGEAESAELDVAPPSPQDAANVIRQWMGDR